MYDDFFPRQTVLIIIHHALSFPENSRAAYWHCLWKINPPIPRVDEIIWLGKYTRNLSILLIISEGAISLLLRLTGLARTQNVFLTGTQLILLASGNLNGYHHSTPTCRRFSTQRGRTHDVPTLSYNIAPRWVCWMIQALTFAYRRGI